MSAADRVLTRVEGLRQRGPGQWSARCPAHRDRAPSLSIREADSGAVLLRCWAGCSIESIVGALGLRLMDLFPPRPDAPGGGTPPARWRLPATQALEVLEREALVALVVGNDMRQKRAINEADYARLSVAVSRIGAVAEEVRRITR